MLLSLEWKFCDLNNVATFARFFSFLILTSSSRTCFGIQKVSRISVFSLLYCFQLIRHQILRSLQHPMLSCSEWMLQISSVVPNLCHQISHGKLHWDKHEITRLAHWLDHWPNISLLQQNPTCLDPPLAQKICALSRQSYSGSNSVFRLPSDQTGVASCSLSLGTHCLGLHHWIVSFSL